MSVRLVCLSAALALLAVLSPMTQADDRKTPPSPEALVAAIAEAGKPGAEHKKLDPLVGQWSFTMKFWTDHSLPPAQMQGTVERKWIMDGRFVQESLQGHCTKTGKEFEGLGLWGYNAAEKQFTNARACSLCGNVASGALSCDTTGSRFESAREETCPLTSQKVKSRDEFVIESNNRIVANFYKTIDGREVKIGEMVSVRQK